MQQYKQHYSLEAAVCFGDNPVLRAEFEQGLVLGVVVRVEKNLHAGS